MIHPETFTTPRALLSWYHEQRFFHKRLARLVTQHLEYQIDTYFRNIRLPVLARINHRDKTIGSIVRNLHYDQYRYSSAESSDTILRKRVHDLAGVRAIFYFSDHVDEFCTTLQKLGVADRFGLHAQTTFVQKGSSTNLSLDAMNEMNYRSWHFDLQVERGTLFYNCLTDIDKYFLHGLYCEVQLRSLLQEAWAEVAHNIAYATKLMPLTRQDEETLKEFNTLSDTLAHADAQFTKLKHVYHYSRELLGSRNKRAEPAPAELSISKSWKYEPPTISGAESYNGVEYGYEILHRSDPDKGHADELVISPISIIFDVDSAMSPYTNGLRYKESMWKKLEREEAEFMASIRYESIVVRVTEWDAATKQMGAQLAAYSDQVVTNHKKAHRKSIPGSAEVPLEAVAFVPDTTDIRGCRVLKSFASSPLSNTLGMATVVLTADERWLIGLRSSSLAFDPGKWGCPASGALQWIELGQWQERDFDSWIRNGIIREMEEELGYTAARKELHYLSFAREFGRLGKPQIFFLTLSTKSSEQMIATFRTYKPIESEYREIKVLETSEARCLVGNNERIVNSILDDAEIGEELRFNLYLALRYMNKL